MTTRQALLIALTLCCGCGGAKSQSLECYTPGECLDAQIIDFIEDLESYNSCLRACQAIETCKWLTYFSHRICILMLDCPRIGTDCDDCFVGQKECDLAPAVCDVDGACDGVVTGFPPADDASLCKKACYDSSDCQWYSYFPKIKFCTLTRDCPALDTSCNGDACVHGEKVCYEDEIAGQLFTVTSGGQIRIVDLVQTGQACPQLPDYPLPVEGATAAVVDGQVLVCGGGFAECNIFDVDSNAWMPSQSLTQSRKYAAAANVDDSRLWVTGGFNGSSDSATTEILTLTSTEAFVQLPEPLAIHNLVKVDANSYVLVGGDASSNKVWLFDGQLEAWSSLPDVPEDNEDFIAGVVTETSGRTRLIVAGGAKPSFSYGLDLTTKEWSSLPPLPEHIYWATSVPNGNSFLVLGGTNSMVVYQFNAFSDDWSVVVGDFDVGIFPAATVLPENYFDCS